MFNTMGSSKSLGKIFLASFVLLLICRISGSSAPSLDYNRDERDALYALKATFNNSFLNRNWTSMHCYMDDPSRWYGIRCNNGRVTGITLEGMELKGTIAFNALIHFSELSILSFKNNSLQGRLMNFSGNQKLARIDLSWNKFYGPMSKSLLSLASLESLELENNNLTGELPELNQTTLIAFNVSNNNISGPIPLTKPFQSFGPHSFSGILKLCGPTLKPCGGTSPPSPPPEANNGLEKDKKHSIFRISICISFGVVALLAGILLVNYYRKKAKNERAEERGEDRKKIVFFENGGGFDWSDLSKASPEGLGEGTFGKTYKATLDDGQALVVKILRDLKPVTRKEFTRQLQLLADQKHPNLIPPVACFFSKHQKLLICRFAEKGNLFNCIHGGRGSKERVPFSWNARLAAAQGVARALHYLHVNFNSRPNVIIPHGNLKSTNVLINQNDTFLVSDYGLSSLVTPPIAMHSMVCFQSPEYQTTQMIYPKTDVWSYGCLLLELITGHVYAHAAPPGVDGLNLCNLVHQAVREDRTIEIFDSEIREERRSTDRMLELLQIAIRCCDESPDKRPEMVEITQEIDNMKGADDWEDELVKSPDDISQSSW